MKAKQFGLLACLAAMVAGISILPAPVAAQGIEFDFDGGGVRIIRPDDYDRRYYRRDERRSYDRRGCSPRQALIAASRHLDEPRINSVSRSYYFIDGYGKRGGNRGGPDSVIISRAPGCERA